MATLRRDKARGNQYFIDYRDIDDQRYRVYTGTVDKKIATLWLKKVEDLLAQAGVGLIPKVGKIDIYTIAGKEKPKEESQEEQTLQKFKEKYLVRLKDDLQLAPKSISLSKNALDSLIDCVTDKKITELTDEDIVAWKKKMASRGKSDTTIGIYFRQMRAAFNRAVQWQWLETNPFLRVSEPKRDQKKKKDKDMSYEEVQLLLKTMKDSGDLQFRNYTLFLLYTGCRRNEILQLKWQDINWEEETLTIYAEKSRQMLEIPINNALMKVVQRMERKEEGYIFTTQSTGRGAQRGVTPWSKDYITHHFKGYITALGLPSHYTVHSLRHTYTTHLRKQGVPLDIIFRLLGHSSPAVTSQNYDHSIATHFRAQADLVDFSEDE